MLTNFKLIPITADSVPFAAAADKCGFAKNGYVEEEYFQYGTANVYTEDAANQVSIIHSDAPYCTRVLIRRPADVAKFSGNVVLEILNSSANIDIDRQWVNSWPFFVRNGDIYVGISSKGHVVGSLKTFDPQRYADINWANPTPERPMSEKFDVHFRWLPQYETGLFWDMLLDLTKLLRSDDSANPIACYGKRWIYLTGWSQSTSYVNRVVRSFAYLPENCKDGPLYDGYLNGGGSAGLAPINQYEPIGHSAGFPTGSIMGAKEPFIAVNTESENRMAMWYGDFDEPEFKFRTWQIAGSSHDSKYNLLVYYGEKDLKMLDDMGIHNAYYGVDGDPMDAPYEPVFSAAYAALFAWARKGIPAPHAPKIETGVSMQKVGAGIFASYVYNKTDALGNCLGGIRTPAINYPTGKYSHTSFDKDGNALGAFGKVNPYSPEMLKSLYGSIENYEQLLNSNYSELVAQGFLLEGDREAFIAHCIECAKQRGL